MGHPGFAALIMTEKGKTKNINKKKAEVQCENTYLKLMSCLIFN